MTFAPGEYSPHCYRGETFTRQFTWRDELGALVDLTDYHAQVSMYYAPMGSRTELQSYIDGDGLTLSGVAGIITWVMEPLDTLSLPDGPIEYSLQVTSPAGVVTYLLSGQIQVQRI
jgi:hypothetical protein